MAKDDKGGKIRVLFVELEGSNETLQESLRTLTTAFSRGVTSTRQAAPVHPVLANGNSSKTQLEIMDNSDHEDIEDVTPATTRPKRARLYRTPTVLELDLKSGNMSFITFCQQKNPTSEIKKYLVIATWFKEYRDTKEIGPDHIFTCYKTMRWTAPKDLGRTFRMGKRAGYFRAVGKGIYAINHVGEGMIDEMGTED